MTRTEIIEHLSKEHQAFLAYTSSLDQDSFFLRATDKWSAAEQVDHILRSLRPLTQALARVPMFVLKMLFGKAPRPSRSYEDVVENYRQALEEGGKASKRYIPKTIRWESREELHRSVSRALTRLIAALHHYTEDELDEVRLPHPLLGKLTIREMLYFTIYHVKHHLRHTQENLSLQ